MNPHISDHPIGTTKPLAWKWTPRESFAATLHRREPHGEEWRVWAVNAVSGGESYLMSVGYQWVVDHETS